MKIGAKIVTSLMMVLSVSSVVCAGDLKITLQGGNPNAGDTVCALVSFDTGKDALGAFHLEFAFNPQDFELERVQPGGDVYFGDLNSKIDNAMGIVRLNAFQGISMTGPVGNVSLAKLFLKPKKGRSSDLVFNPVRVEFITPDGNLIKD